MDLFEDTGAINFSYYSQFPVNSVKGGGDRGAGRVQEAEEERAGSGSSKRIGSGREMQNANYCHLLIRSTTVENKNPKCYLIYI